MLDVNEDAEYRQLKGQVKNKELAAMVWSGLGTLCMGAVYGLAMLEIAAPLAIAGGVVAAVVGLFSAYKAFRTGQDVRFDTEELQARREATNLARAMGQARSPEEQAVVGHVVHKQREERHKKAEEAKEKVKKWTEVVTTPLSDTTQLSR